MSPTTLDEGFTWHFQLVRAACHVLGTEYVQRVFTQLQGVQITTMFSGLDMAAQAWEMLQVAALELVGTNIGAKLGSMCEIDKGCQRFLAANWPDRCLFKDVLEWEAPPEAASSASSSATSAPQKLNLLASCLNHGKQCRLYTRAFMDVSGPPCVLWSRPFARLMQTCSVGASVIMQVGRWGQCDSCKASQSLCPLCCVLIGPRQAWTATGCQRCAEDPRPQDLRGKVAPLPASSGCPRECAGL